MTSVLLVTPTDCSAASQAHLGVLLASLGRQAPRCELVLVLRGGGPVDLPAPPPNVRVHHVPAPMATSLSRARNLALDHARAHGILGRCDVVAFPDDDLAYPPHSLTRAAEAVTAGARLVCGAYAPAVDRVDRGRFPADARPVDTRLVTSSQSSGTMFLDAALVAALGPFDERLGLGAAIGSAEDTDYMIRALRLGATARYDPELVLLHPYKEHRHEEYFAGSVAVLAKHALGRRGTAEALARRLAVGLLLVLRRRLRPGSYASGLAAGARIVASPA